MKIETKYDTRRILTIQDQHFPYHHPDIFPFLREVQKRIKPTLVVNMGDEVDNHDISFHDSDPNLPSAGDELKMAAKCLRKLEKLFPKMVLLDSNHGSLAHRKFIANGIPQEYLKPLNDVYGVGKGWEWVNDLTIALPNGQPTYFCHGKRKNGTLLAQQYGMNVVQGHYHESMDIGYISNPLNLIWSMQAGCLVDSKSLALAYAKLNPRRPIIGTGAIINSLPLLIPMCLDKNGNWLGPRSLVI